MVWIEGLLITLMICAGFLCSQKDIRDGIIPNRIVFSTCIPVAVLQGVYVFAFIRKGCLPWLMNMGIADVFALLMYAGGLWAAGDVKLFALMYLCIPGRLLDGGTLTHSIVPYFFIFFPAIAWLVIDSIIHSIRGSVKIADSKFSFSEMAKRWVIITVEIGLFNQIFSLIATDFVSDNPLFCSVIMLVYAYWCGSKAFMQRTLLVVIQAGLLAVLWLIRPLSFSGVSFLNYCAIVVILFFQQWTNRFNYMEIPTTEVCPGMILSAGTVIKFTTSRVHNLPTDMSEGMSARITPLQAEAVQRWASSAKGENSVTIVRKIPFGIFIFVGFVLWLGMRIVR